MKCNVNVKSNLRLYQTKSFKFLVAVKKIGISGWNF